MAIGDIDDAVTDMRSICRSRRVTESIDEKMDMFMRMCLIFEILDDEMSNGAEKPIQWRMADEKGE